MGTLENKNVYYDILFKRNKKICPCALAVKEFKKVDSHNLYKFKIYEGEKEIHFTYCTPEAASLIDEQSDYSRRSGEKLTDDSFLIRELFDINGLAQVTKKARPVASKTLVARITELPFRFSLKCYRCDFKPQSKKEYDFDFHQNHPRLCGYPNSASIKHYRLKAQGMLWEDKFRSAY